MLNHHQLYDNDIKNMIYNNFQHLAIILSVLLNGTLVALILKGNRKEFGSYRYLLISFASVDIYYGLVHFLIQPIPEMWGNCFFMAGHGYVTGKLAVSFYASAHSHSYVVLVFHFLYRLLAVKGSPYSRLFSKPWFYGVIFLCNVAVGASWFSAMLWLYDTSDFVVEYMKPILECHSITSSQDVHQYVIGLFWSNGTFSGPRWAPLSGLVMMAATMLFCYGYMVYAARQIGKYMTSHTGKQSEKTNRMTKTLMRALTYQTMLPVMTAYVPPLIALMFPLLGLAEFFPYIADISPILFGIHPLIDGCVLIYTIKEYRRLLISWLSCRRKALTAQTQSIATRTSHIMS